MVVLSYFSVSISSFLLHQIETFYLIIKCNNVCRLCVCVSGIRIKGKLEINLNKKKQKQNLVCLQVVHQIHSFIQLLKLPFNSSFFFFLFRIACYFSRHSSTFNIYSNYHSLWSFNIFLFSFFWYSKTKSFD